MSVDSVPANREFAKQIEVTFPILSDFKRTVVKDYGVFNEEQGFGNRATFLIDKEGTPAERRCSTRCRPTNPVPPVTSAFTARGRRAGRSCIR